MNYKMIKYFLGVMLKLNSAILIIPLMVSMYFNDNFDYAFLPSIIISFALGFLLSEKLPDKTRIYEKEGMVIVVLTWVLFSLIGALPFYISKCIPSFIDSFFETVSGFTTTGSTILTDIEVLPKSILFWRALTHWIGGMGVLVFAVAILPKTNSRAMHILQSEMTGPTVGKITSRLKTNAQILYIIYLILTLLQIILLMIGKMPLFDSLITAFSTAGTGGFAIKNASMAYYDSYYLDMVVSVFMILFGINFNLFYFLIFKDAKRAFQSQELKLFLSIIIISTTLICINTANMYSSLSENFRYSFFQVTSIMSTTGFITYDYTKWPQFSQAIIMLLMIFGSCAGSTAGGLKLSRVLILFKQIRLSLQKAVHPNWSSIATMDSKVIDDKVMRSTSSYFIIYIFLFIITTMLFTAFGLDMQSAFSAASTSLNNVGPGLGTIGPVDNFFHLNVPTKLLLCFNMIAGRLEIIPVLALFSYKTWKK